MGSAAEERSGPGAPDDHLDQVHESFLNRPNDLVRAYRLMKSLHLDGFPPALHAQHHRTRQVPPLPEPA